MSESNMWRNMRQRMHPYWDEATRHEDKFNSGIADVSFVCGGAHGWIELKQIDAWPKRDRTIVRCKHYTKQQRDFLKAKGAAGGNAWLFVKIGREYLLFDWQQAQQVFVSELNTAETRMLAYSTWKGRMDWGDLSDILALGNNIFSATDSF
ncbi:MAG: hypothetical protein GY794_16175 [bacterium]|nr:hypothetical protein [bacterium]